MHVNVTAATLISVEEAGFVDTARMTGKMIPMAGVSAIVSYIVYMEFYGIHWTVMVQMPIPDF